MLVVVFKERGGYCVEIPSESSLKIYWTIGEMREEALRGGAASKVKRRADLYDIVRIEPLSTETIDQPYCFSSLRTEPIFTDICISHIAHLKI